jgi:cell shape-determining protein MreD
MGAQFHVLPPLMVFCALKTDVATVTMLACVGGLLTDALSADPFGASVMPLLWAGLTYHRWREWILQDFAYAQFVLGAAASAAVPVLRLGLVLSLGEQPLLGWGSFWQLAVIAITGGLLTLAVFRWLSLMTRLFAYRVVSPVSFRADREIKYGRY